MKILDIIPGTSVDGPGLRTAIYVAGCRHECRGCHNPQSWDFDSGRELPPDEILAQVEEHGFDVTLTGGDPLYHATELIPLVKEITDRGYTVWCYTGFTYPAALDQPGARELLAMCEVLVDGPFIESERDISLHFRGSANQRLIDLRRSTPARIHLWSPEEF
ncbi:MAG: anaerobic ribonucleoside-triphosphate reductase activating protein [Duncaniella sp.]|nr:anaerobic ribonucleoside-triphosphate reductase activating protein [Duncaniella sp.]